MRKVGFLIIPMLSWYCISSCSQERNKKEMDACSVYSQQGAEALNDYLYNGKDKKKLLNSLALYDSAINCDSLNSINYQSKITILGLLNRQQEVIDVLDK